MLFGPEWHEPEPPKPEPRPKKARKLPVCPDWIADACRCENCGRPRIAGKRRVAACPQPGCAKLVTGLMFAERVRKARAAQEERQPELPKLERCLRLAWAYMRGRMRRGNADAKV